MHRKNEIDTKGKGLYLILATLALLLLMVMTTLLWWLISPRLHEVGSAISIPIAFIVLTLLRLFYLVVLTGIFSIIFTCTFEKNILFLAMPIRITTRFLYLPVIYIGKMAGITKDRIRESFVYVNNAFVKANYRKYYANEILLLLPHCLQKADCNIRITNNIYNCAECGNCDIMELKRIAEKYRISAAIATGGTLARKIIIQNKPKLIIAVACQRDLVSGIQDVFPIPTYGVLNQRPEGPCINTRIDYEKIERFLKGILA